MTEKREPSPAAATMVLVPGFWLGEWAWDAVATRLHTAGVAVEALTLPGLQPGTTDADVTLDDQIAAVVAAISRASGPVVLVGHSGAGTVITGAADRAPASLAGLVFVDSGPVADGAVASPDLAPEVHSIELPDWQTLEAAGSSLEGLDAAARAEFRRRAVPHPAGPARHPIVLTDDRRHDIPVTLVCCSITTQQVREMTAAGHPWFQELGSFAAVELIDLPTGHWPMWSRPDDLADELRRIAVRSSSAR